MFLMRLLLLLLVGIMARRLYRGFKAAGQMKRRQETDEVQTPGGGPGEPGYPDLTEQGIDDADFEEIP
jgi:hypothetical protein